MPLYGIDCWKELMERGMWLITDFLPKANLKPVLTDYIYHKNEKGKTSELDSPLLKNDITRNFWK